MIFRAEFRPSLRDSRGLFPSFPSDKSLGYSRSPLRGGRNRHVPIGLCITTSPAGGTYQSRPAGGTYSTVNEAGAVETCVSGS